MTCLIFYHISNKHFQTNNYPVKFFQNLFWNVGQVDVASRQSLNGHKTSFKI